MERAAAVLNEFLEGFASAYLPGTVPEDEQVPYITYSANFPEWNQKASNYIQVWDKGKSNTRITRIADRIAAAIREHKRIKFEGGYLVLWPETPLIQIRAEDGDDARYAYINYSINAYNLPGV